MGLDMYAWKTKEKDLSKDNLELDELAYWRKHNRLHGYMGALWEEKGFPNQRDEGDYQFNCIPLELKKEDLLKLRKAIKEQSMPDTNGFFFGHDSYDQGEYQEEVDKYDLKFVTDALRAIRNGYKIVYDSWW